MNVASEYYLSRRLELAEFPTGFANPVVVILGIRPYYQLTPQVFAWLSFTINTLAVTNPSHPEMNTIIFPTYQSLIHLTNRIWTVDQQIEWDTQYARPRRIFAGTTSPPLLKQLSQHIPGWMLEDLEQDQNPNPPKARELPRLTKKDQWIKGRGR